MSSQNEQEQEILEVPKAPRLRPIPNPPMVNYDMHSVHDKVESLRREILQATKYSPDLEKRLLAVRD